MFIELTKVLIVIILFIYIIGVFSQLSSFYFAEYAGNMTWKFRYRLFKIALMWPKIKYIEYKFSKLDKKENNSNTKDK